MAHAITFQPAPVDPHQELMKRVDAASREHAEALLVAWDLLQTAHDQGILDLAQGLIGGKNLIAGKLAEAANLPESVAGIRNGIAFARVLGSLDPDMLQRRLDVEGHDVCRVYRPQALKILRPDSLGDPGHLLLDLGLVRLVLGIHR